MLCLIPQSIATMWHLAGTAACLELEECQSGSAHARVSRGATDWTRFAPVIGADRPEYVDDVFGALEIKLTREEHQALDKVSQWEIPGQYL